MSYVMDTKDEVSMDLSGRFQSILQKIRLGTENLTADPSSIDNATWKTLCNQALMLQGTAESASDIQIANAPATWAQELEQFHKTKEDTVQGMRRFGVEVFGSSEDAARKAWDETLKECDLVTLALNSPGNNGCKSERDKALQTGEAALSQLVDNAKRINMRQLEGLVNTTVNHFISVMNFLPPPGVSRSRIEAEKHWDRADRGLQAMHEALDKGNIDDWKRILEHVSTSHSHLKDYLLEANILKNLQEG